MRPLANRAVMPYFVAVMLGSIPFWIAGSIFRGELIPGVPVGAAMVVVPGLVAIALAARVAGVGGALRWLRFALLPDMTASRSWFLIAVLTPPAIMIATYVVMREVGYDMPEPELKIDRLFTLLLIFLVPALLEELGWSGYAIDSLQDKKSALSASSIVGGAWAAWHFVPLLQVGRTVGWIAWWSLGTIALRIIITWIYNNSGRSCLAAAIAHASENVSWQAFPNNGSHYDPGWHGVVLVIASGAIVLMFGGKDLTRRNRI